ncbi:ralBP1-associated Eps domain-containing protein 2-like isoform X2 [Acipenser oxyrinchus oxyrinchus]|uniref:RalBP1-associated Eps domain-containing protein 2-like isoform X2 n=1 Tax=Acipenser oxyrinchus oxyrinchus TaxID=40147 RepID=A0AAD8G8P4_ACIOX|nr:ralBP1-associated Eps domain-containing protein 2-like isoform X2 [Acipenser oxyrinchus oxyrinchus]
MDQGPGTVSGGGFISLSENEQRCYSDLYTLCKADSSGKLAASKVGELFRASQLPADTLHQVTELCGAKRLGYFGTGQFYVALKLLAAAQSGFPVRLESIKSEMPLPRFVGMKNDAEVLRYPNHSQNTESQGHQLGKPPTTIAWPSLDKNSLKRTESLGDKQAPQSPPPSPPNSPSSSSYQDKALSYSYRKQWNSTEQLTASYESKHPSRPLLQQEVSSPSNYGSKSSLTHSSVTQALSVERSAEEGSADNHDDPWRITEEQRDYYTIQFKSLQPDLSSLISGSVAKNFFTKSKLSIPELSHIWELSDVDCDGALTLPEFCAAFHLIVARKNGYSLPEKLPQTLQPAFLQIDAVSPKTKRDGAFLGSYSELVPSSQQKEPAHSEQWEAINELPTTPEPLIVFEDESGTAPQETNTVESTHPPLSDKSTSKQEPRIDSCMSAFSPKRNPAFKDTSVDEHTPVENPPAAKTDPPQELEHQVKSRTRQRSYSSTSIDDAMKKVEEPPRPPPRPQKTHSRASSLDLNTIFQQNSQGFKRGWLPPPALPPRPLAGQIPHFVSSTETTSQQKPVRKLNFADFSKFSEEEENAAKNEAQGQLSKAAGSSEESSPLKKDILPAQPPLKPIRRKYRLESQNLDSQEPTPPLPPPSSSSAPGTKPYPPVQKQSSRQKRAIQTAIRKNKEANAVLARLNSELQQQLKEAHLDRITLETQLDQLRPVSYL